MSFVIENESIVLRKTGLNELDAIIAMEQETKDSHISTNILS